MLRRDGTLQHSKFPPKKRNSYSTVQYRTYPLLTLFPTIDLPRHSHRDRHSIAILYCIRSSILPSFPPSLSLSPLTLVQHSPLLSSPVLYFTYITYLAAYATLRYPARQNRTIRIKRKSKGRCKCDAWRASARYLLYLSIHPPTYLDIYLFYLLR